MELTDSHFNTWLDTSTAVSVVNGRATMNWLPSGFRESGKWSDALTEERMTALFAKEGLDWSSVFRVEPTIDNRLGSGYLAYDDTGQTIYNSKGQPVFIPTEMMQTQDAIRQPQDDIDRAEARTSPKRTRTYMARQRGN